MAGLRKDRQSAPRDCALKKMARLKAVVILITDHYQNRRLHRAELRFEIIERGPTHLHATHRVGGATRIVLSQPVSEQTPSPWIFFLELHSRSAFSVDRSETLRAALLEIFGYLLRNPLKVILIGFFGPVARSGSNDGQQALGMTKRRVQACKAPHRETNNVSLVDSCRI